LSLRLQVWPAGHCVLAFGLLGAPSVQDAGGPASTGVVLHAPFSQANVQVESVAMYEHRPAVPHVPLDE
jgi:hypothetical protein